MFAKKISDIFSSGNRYLDCLQFSNLQNLAKLSYVKMNKMNTMLKHIFPEFLYPSMDFSSLVFCFILYRVISRLKKKWTRLRMNITNV